LRSDKGAVAGVAVVVFVQRIVLQCLFFLDVLGGQTRDTELYGIGIVACMGLLPRAHRGNLPYIEMKHRFPEWRWLYENCASLLKKKH